MLSEKIYLLLWNINNFYKYFSVNWPFLFSLFPQDDYKSNPNIQISELTSSDKCARELWRNNGGKKCDLKHTLKNVTR